MGHRTTFLTIEPLLYHDRPIGQEGRLERYRLKGGSGGGDRQFAWKVWGVRAKVTRLEEVHLPGAGYSLGAAAHPQLPLAQGLGEPPVGSRRRGLLREGR
jgi:hypothetical protein